MQIFLSIEQAVTALKDGKIIVYPTEGVFGIGCDPKNIEAIKQLLTIKQRQADKGLIIVASNIEQVNEYAELNNSILDKLQDIWTTNKPHFVTCLLPAKPNCPQILRGNHETVAVRISKHPVIIDLCNKFGSAVISTSANTSNQNPAMSYEQIELYFDNYIGKEIAGTLVGELGGADKPSKIISFDNDIIHIIRE